MKFLKLEILNLASLDRKEGETINFEEGALGNSTIFSIVGPTGSGKSTILDAICLALYNRAPRYPKKKGDRKQNIEIFGELDEGERNRLAPTDPRNILTKGKKEGYSKLTFLANNGCVYRAEWHVKFQRVNYDDSLTLLYKIGTEHGRPVEENANWDELTSIIGLDYEQFLRTVLIAQGSFANFLTAKENERYELLEKLIGCEELYTNIATGIKEQKDAAVKKYEQIAASFSAQEKELIPDGELATLKDEIASLEESQKKAKEELDIIAKALEWFSAEDKFIENISKYDDLFATAKHNLETIGEQAGRLSLHDATLPAISLYKEVLSHGENIDQSAKTLKMLDDSISIKLQNIKDENSKLDTLKTAAQAKAHELEVQKPHIDKARQISAQLKAAGQDVTDKTSAHTDAKNAFAKAGKAVTDNKQAIDKAQKAVSTAQSELDKLLKTGQETGKNLKEKADRAISLHGAELQKLKGIDVDKLQEDNTKAQDTLTDLNNAIRIRKDIQRKTDNLNKIKGQQNNLTLRNKAISEMLNKFNIDGMTKELDVLNKSYTLMTSKDWKTHRGSLEEGAPCPLCGATHHPFSSTEAFIPVENELRDLIASKQQTLDKATADKQTLESEKSNNKGKLDVIDDSIKTLSDEISGQIEQWSQITGRHPNWPEDTESLKLMLADIEKAALQAASRLTDYYNLLKQVNQLSKDKEKADNDYKKHQEEEAALEKQAQNNVNKCNTALAAEQGKTDNLNSQLNEKECAMNTAKTALDKANAEFEALKASLRAEIGDKNPEVFEMELTQAKETAAQAVTEQTASISKMETELGTLQGQVEATRKSQEQEKNKLQTATGSLENWLAAYNSDNSHTQTLGKDDIAALNLATDDWEEIRLKQKNLTGALTSAKTTLDNENKKHKEHQAAKPVVDKEALAGKKLELEGRSTVSNDRLVNLKARLHCHKEAMLKIGSMYDMKIEAQGLKDEWEEIADAIGGDGKTLRKMAQCYTLRFLIEHANVEIRKFNTRYELKQVKNSLGIRVIDHDRADDVRDTTSLSGGETFIVSLGLALGLSSLSSRNISFENLFIDEGFGTLDPETLATVIDSLAMLQSSQGKKVGVISHTDTMSERITTQIRIIKNGSSGSSHVEIYPQ